jgi:hypothetical protein
LPGSHLDITLADGSQLKLAGQANLISVQFHRGEHEHQRQSTRQGIPEGTLAADTVPGRGWFLPLPSSIRRRVRDGGDLGGC